MKEIFLFFSIIVYILYSFIYNKYFLLLYKAFHVALKLSKIHHLNTPTAYTC